VIIERIKFFFISSVNWVSANSDEENGRPGASQMKPARTAGSALSLLREFFPSSVGLLQRNQVVRSSDRKGVRRAGERLSKSPRCFDTQGYFHFAAYCLFATTCGAGLLISSCALTFWICAACSFTIPARRATVPSNSAILFC